MRGREELAAELVGLAAAVVAGQVRLMAWTIVPRGTTTAHCSIFMPSMLDGKEWRLGLDAIHALHECSVEGMFATAGPGDDDEADA